MLRRFVLLAIVGTSLPAAGAALAQDAPEVRTAFHAEGVSEIRGINGHGLDVAALATPQPVARS